MQRESKMYNCKLIKSGSLLEVMRYESTQYRLQRSTKPPQHKSARNTSPEHERHLKTSSKRAVHMLRRLIACNFKEGDTFITLTFKEDIRNLQVADDHMKSFKKAIQRYTSKNNQIFKCVYTTEFQERRGGTLHYHMICNLSLIPKATIQHYWKHGKVDIEVIDNIASSSLKLSQYMLKLGYDQRLGNRKRYSPSRNLDKPSTKYFNRELEMFKEIGDAQFVNGYEYSNEYTGCVKYEEYLKINS